jgi:hypothetical protein
MPIAMEFDVGGGRVLFLPVLPEDTGSIRSDTAEAIIDLFGELVPSTGEDDAPHWTRSVAVPGLEQAEAEMEETAGVAAEAAAAADTARARHDMLASHRALLWAEGRRHAVAVESALRLLGFNVLAEEAGGLRIGDGERTALVESESTREEVVEWPYVRLQRRLESALLTQSEKLGGLVIANGHRQREPAERPPEFSEPLRLACENYRYGLLTGQTLFALVQRALAGADDGWLVGARRRLLSGVGEIPLAMALGEVTEGSDAGPIF